MNARRLFFALWPDEAMRAALSAAVEGCMRALHGSRPVPSSNLHVTLAFLGSVPEASIARLRGLAQEVSRGGAAGRAANAARASEQAPRDELSSVAVAMRLERLEHWRRAELLCAAPSEMPAGAAALSDALKSALLAADFHPDLKPFRAHVTLARRVHRVPTDAAMLPVMWTFRELSLIESRTLPEGSSYSVVDSWVLGSGVSAS